ncbi:hypothetical protein [Mucilaginibacter ginsenosidivorans]|uniref:hypothetical protein n=1 Tax=Mucilaginibacter ginsenosidivorans TaxID=398053 RepID=UPI001652B6E2|nr:hypothetical protein [Mucilaginibacter ginsenosidivorans]
METAVKNVKRSAQDVVQGISRELADRLIGGFKQKFPGEQQTVFIARDTRTQFYHEYYL